MVFTIYSDICNVLIFGNMYWDTTQAQPAQVQQLPDKCYAITVIYPLMVVGTVD
jgi:hypothetical protein